MRASIDHFDAAVEHGGCVVSAERGVILALVKTATESGASATFYVTKAQFDAVTDWYWTPERRQRHYVEEVSVEEQRRIETELGIRHAGFRYSNRLTCGKCGSVYGAFEFVQQGVREHGREIVETALNLPNAGVVRINPNGVVVCQTCRANHSGGVSHYYSCQSYTCCRMEAV